MLVEGEAGIGKTRLLAQVLEDARLADPGLAPHQDDRWPARSDPVQGFAQSLDLILTPNTTAGRTFQPCRR